jgi:serine/threonine protein kinase
MLRLYASQAVSGSGRDELAHARTVPIANDMGLRGPTSIGRYRILGALGAGGMGSVLSAFDPELDRTVALKVLHQDPSTDADELRLRLAREARAIAKLTHPNVVTVYDVGRDERTGQLFVAMELVEGTTLREWLKRVPRTEGEVLRALVSAGQGLNAAHRAGLVHRDFKPENVLCGNDGRVLVTDFGLARPPRGPFPTVPTAGGQPCCRREETSCGLGSRTSGSHMGISLLNRLSRLLRPTRPLHHRGHRCRQATRHCRLPCAKTSASMRVAMIGRTMEFATTAARVRIIPLADLDSAPIA